MSKQNIRENIVFSKHSIFGHIGQGAVMTCIYAGPSFYVETKETKKRCYIRTGTRLLVSPVENRVEVFGRLGNFRDEDGVYHTGSIEIAPKDLRVETEVALHNERTIFNNWSCVGISDDEAKKIQDLDTEAVNPKKFYACLDKEEVAENVKATGGSLIRKGMETLKSIWN